MFKLNVLLVAGALAVSLPVSAEPPTSVKKVLSDNPVAVDVATKSLRERLALLPQFSATFEQHVYDAKQAVIQQANGEVSVAQPNQFRWVTHEPDESLIVSNGSAVWVYNPFVEQVSIMNLDDTVKQSPLWLIANQSDKAWSGFKVTQTNDTYTITPRDPQSLTRQITMTFSGSALTQLTLNDSQGQSSVFGFSKFNQTPTFDEQTFMFVPPAGVDIDDQRVNP